eukprot:scaffold168046_cov19-Tisochrysis_lutea.AAC.1
MRPVYSTNKGCKRFMYRLHQCTNSTLHPVNFKFKFYFTACRQAPSANPGCRPKFSSSPPRRTSCKTQPRAYGGLCLSAWFLFRTGKP